MRAVAGLLLLSALLIVSSVEASNIQSLGDDTLQQAIARGPLFVSFCNPYIGACKLLHRVLNELAVKLADAKASVQVATVDVSVNPNAKNRFRAKDLPTILLLQGLGISFNSSLVDRLFAFATGGTPEEKEAPKEMESFGPNALGPRFGPIPPVLPKIPQWFTSTTFVGADGKEYQGASF